MRHPGLAARIAACLLGTLAAPLWAQNWTQRGFVEIRSTAYPQTTPVDRARVVAEFLARYEPSLRVRDSLRIEASVDARSDSHHQVERDLRLDYRDRSARRPALSLRRASLLWSRGIFTIEAGKQFVRWGRTDILNPTDRFAPRDLITVLDNEYLGVTAVRITMERGANTLDAVWTPQFTPTRLPLTGHRWSAAFPLAVRVVTDDPASYPSGGQAGVRWSRRGKIEHALMWFEGTNHSPGFSLRPTGFVPELRTYYPRMRMWGGDVSVPLPGLLVKAEGGWVQSRDSRVRNYGLYVVQAERQSGEWFVIGGYAGEVRGAGPGANAASGLDRGYAGTIIARTGLTIDSTRSIAGDFIIRRTGTGGWLRGEYSQTVGSHVRMTLMASLIRGRADDFIGQFRRNSNVAVVLRYSF